MKYFLILFSCLSLLFSKATDTLYVEEITDERYLRYLDSVKAYEISYSVAKNVADTMKSILGNNSLDNYFLGRFTSDEVQSSGEYFYGFSTDVKVEPGKVNIDYRNMKNDARFPWKYLERQYKRLNAITIAPSGVMQGAELPNVYIYLPPSTTVIQQRVKRFTVIDPSIKFYVKDNGKTRISYIRKFYYSQVDGEHQKIDSIEKLDPIYQKRLVIEE